MWGVFAICGLLFVIGESVGSPSNNCAGVKCTPNPGGCTANYADGGCCPAWQCSDGHGGMSVVKGMTRSGLTGKSYHSSSSFTTRSGDGGGGESFVSSSSSFGTGTGTGLGGGYTRMFDGGFDDGFPGESTRVASNRKKNSYSSSGSYERSSSSSEEGPPAVGYRPYINTAAIVQNFLRAHLPHWFPTRRYY